jgi:cytochrome o ubiquinol oxidase operon protein cyoD
MSAHDAAPPGRHEAGHSHGSRRGYLIGFALSLVLTAIPFWLAMSGVLDNRTTAILVTLLAFAQIVVHTIFFLHVNTKAEGGWILMALIFTAVMICIVISGSLWIMYHLHGNMTPPPVEALPQAAE